MLKTKQPITSINGFRIGDKVRLIDGDGRPHIIKSFSIDGMKEFFFEVQFEDGTEAMLNNIAPLTSDVDMAAEEYAENILAGGEDMFDAIADGFKAGAEWMAGQGETEIVKVDVNGMNTPIVYLWGDKWKKYSGDKVVVQIRKK